MSVECRKQILSGTSSACGVAARADISKQTNLISSSMLALKFDALCEICLDQHELSDSIAWQVCHDLSMSVECRVQVLSGMSSVCGVTGRADIS